MTNWIDRQRWYNKEMKIISYNRLIGLATLLVAALLLLFILLPVGLLYFHMIDWTKWQKFGNIVGWSVGFLFYLVLATNAEACEVVGGAARYVQHAPSSELSTLLIFNH